MIFLGVAALVAAYLRIGWRHALADRKRAWAKARAMWGHKNHAYALESVRWAMIRMTAFWPIIMFARTFDNALRAGDPVHIAQETRRHARLNAAMAQRTRELEEELGMVPLGLELKG